MVVGKRGKRGGGGGGGGADVGCVSCESVLTRDEHLGTRPARATLSEAARECHSQHCPDLECGQKSISGSEVHFLALSTVLEHAGALALEWRQMDAPNC